MHPTLLDLDRDLVVIGLSTRTSPARAVEDIPALWQRFLGGGPPAGDIYAVYCDYAADFRGEYTLVLGTLAEPSAPVPADRRRVRIPRGAYAAFQRRGDPQQVVWQTWMHVNGEWRDRERRRYIADFERYHGDEIEIAVGVDGPLAPT